MKLVKMLWCALLAFLFGAQLPLFSQSANHVIDEVIWVVGDEAILRSDVETARLEFGANISGNPYCVIPEQLAIQKLFLHQAQLDSVDIPASNVSANVEERLNQLIMRAGSKEKLEEYYHKTMTQLREMLFESTKEQYTVQKVRENLTSDIKVTPAEVRRYFKDVPQDSLPWIPAQVEVQIITMQPRIPQEEIDRVKDELREYTERVNSGESSFSTLAILYSEDPGTARYGGELDYTGKGELDPAFANVAFSLTDPKKISKVVESEYGYHIIQLIDKRGDKVKIRHILRKPRLDQADIDVAIARLDTVAEDLRKEKFTFDEAATYLSDDKDTRKNKGLMTNTKYDPSTGEQTRTSRFQLQDLPQEIAKVVSTMNTGEISEPFMMINNKGKEVCAIVKLKAHIKAHRATMAEDFQILKDVVLAKRKEEKIKEWIKEKQQTTYIRINEEWRNCEFEYPGWIK
ncbi:MAG: peptidylprolyl isomerase [Paraprevotella sp.]|nr:peptidylprolyl isomerase [Paraprevotella sp.]MBQ8283338.1 peptidylprolyl isomerase [Paraprevotella sp.]